MDNVVQLTTSHQRQAKLLRDRLWNPPNGRHSTELDIVSATEGRKRRAETAKQDKAQRELAKLAHEDFKRQTALDDLMRKVVAEHVRAKTIAARIILEEGPRPPTIREILRVVSEAYGIPIVEIISRRRGGRVIEPRQVTIYLARTLTFNSFPMIGHAIGHRDHTTALHSYERIRMRMLDDEELKQKVIGFQKQLVRVEDRAIFAVPA